MYQKLLDHLDQHKISYELFQHPVLRSVQELEENLPFSPDHFLKVVAFRIKDGDYVLAATGGKERVDYRKIAGIFHTNRRQLRALSPDQLLSELGMEVGGATPISLRPDVQVVIDDNMLTVDTVYTGSTKATKTLAIKMIDLLELQHVQTGDIIK
jgi:Cys-tRNA(Pro)/Cys-tRNA(Cys) deacylase